MVTCEFTALDAAPLERDAKAQILPLRTHLLYTSQPDLSDSEPLPTDRQSKWYVAATPFCDKNAQLLTSRKAPAGKQKKKWSKGKGTRTPTSILRAHRATQ